MDGNEHDPLVELMEKRRVRDEKAAADRTKQLRLEIRELTDKVDSHQVAINSIWEALAKIKPMEN